MAYFTWSRNTAATSPSSSWSFSAWLCLRRSSASFLRASAFFCWAVFAGTIVFFVGAALLACLGISCEKPTSANHESPANVDIHLMGGGILARKGASYRTTVKDSVLAPRRCRRERSSPVVRAYPTCH